MLYIEQRTMLYPYTRYISVEKCIVGRCPLACRCESIVSHSVKSLFISDLPCFFALWSVWNSLYSLSLPVSDLRIQSLCWFHLSLLRPLSSPAYFVSTFRLDFWICLLRRSSRVLWLCWFHPDPLLCWFHPAPWLHLLRWFLPAPSLCLCHIPCLRLLLRALHGPQT